MNTLTQAPTGNTIAQQAKVIAKAPKAKPVTTKKAGEPTAGEYAPANANITAHKLGTLIIDHLWQAAAYVGGAEGHPKRGYAERLMLALALRPEGVTKGDFTVIKGRQGFAENCLYHAGDVPKQRAGIAYGWVHVSYGANGERIARLTAKGAAYLKRMGLPAQFIDRTARPYVAPGQPKAPKVAKGDKPATDKPAKTPKPRNGAGKAAGKPKVTPATTPAATPANVTSEAPKPVMTAPAAQGTVDAPKVG